MTSQAPRFIRSLWMLINFQHLQFTFHHVVLLKSSNMNFCCVLLSIFISQSNKSSSSSSSLNIKGHFHVQVFFSDAYSLLLVVNVSLPSVCRHTNVHRAQIAISMSFGFKSTRFCVWACRLLSFALAPPHIQLLNLMWQQRWKIMLIFHFFSCLATTFL